MAEKVAEKIASFEIKEKLERSVGAFEIRKTDKKMQMAREKIIGILNQVLTRLLNFWMSSTHTFGLMIKPKLLNIACFLLNIKS